MREFNTAPLEVRKTVSQDFQTHPYECGWASEAIFFIHVEEIAGENAQLTATVELSNDGIHWIPDGTRSEIISSKGLHLIKATHFGGWLRLDCSVAGEHAQFRLNIQLALKG